MAKTRCLLEIVGPFEQVHFVRNYQRRFSFFCFFCARFVTIDFAVIVLNEFMHPLFEGLTVEIIGNIVARREHAHRVTFEYRIGNRAS